MSESACSCSLMRVLRCIWNIPICGGFCAPTKSPEPSALRHFSNEYTVPGSGVYMRAGPLIEWSPCCIFTGRLGFGWGTRHRRPVMVTAFAVSVLAWVLTIYPMLAISMNEDIIQWAAWVKGDLVVGNHSARGDIYVGLRGRLDEVDCHRSADLAACEASIEAFAASRAPFHAVRHGVYRRVISWSGPDACWHIDDVDGSSEVMPLCEACRDSVAESVSFVVMGVITMLPQMTTDLQRSTIFGDVNCQATMGFLTSTFGFFSNLMSLRSFSWSCWRNFPAEFDGAKAKWQPGPAFIALLCASILKLWDAISHFIVPTPEARGRKPPAEIEELADFMALAYKEEEAKPVQSQMESEDEGTGSETLPERDLEAPKQGKSSGCQACSQPPEEWVPRSPRGAAILGPKSAKSSHI